MHLYSHIIHPPTMYALSEYQLYHSYSSQKFRNWIALFKIKIPIAFIWLKCLIRERWMDRMGSWSHRHSKAIAGQLLREERTAGGENSRQTTCQMHPAWLFIDMVTWIRSYERTGLKYYISSNFWYVQRQTTCQTYPVRLFIDKVTKNTNIWIWPCEWTGSKYYKD